MHFAKHDGIAFSLGPCYKDVNHHLHIKHRAKGKENERSKWTNQDQIDNQINARA